MAGAERWERALSWVCSKTTARCLPGWQGAAAAAAGTRLVRQIRVFKTSQNGLGCRDLKDHPVPTPLPLEPHSNVLRSSGEHSLLMPEGWDNLALPSSLRYRAVTYMNSADWELWIWDLSVFRSHPNPNGCSSHLSVCSDHR